MEQGSGVVAVFSRQLNGRTPQHLMVYNSANDSVCVRKENKDARKGTIKEGMEGAMAQLQQEKTKGGSRWCARDCVGA